MISVLISEELKSKVPLLRLACISAGVKVNQKDELLWEQITDKIEMISSGLQVEQISKLPEIASSRKAYKACGKDPARYRPSSEALLRRVVKKKDIFRINNVVDLLNLISISTGYSIGGYDMDKIIGDVIFGIGNNDEAYEGIGRGALNIEYLPVFRDNAGAFGSPTSDSERTAVIMGTKNFLMIIIDFGSHESLDEAASMAKKLLEQHAWADKIEVKIVL
jgi:DNA/RNA-binding domain of Phe-tRNA-synthetase-like protein